MLPIRQTVDRPPARRSPGRCSTELRPIPNRAVLRGRDRAAGLRTELDDSDRNLGAAGRPGLIRPARRRLPPPNAMLGMPGRLRLTRPAPTSSLPPAKEILGTPGRPGLSRPGPSRPGPSQPGPSRPGLSRPGPSQPGPSRTGLSGPGCAAGADRVPAAEGDPAHPRPEQAMPVDAVAVTVGPAPDRSAPDRIRPPDLARRDRRCWSASPSRTGRCGTTLAAGRAHRSGGSCHPGTRIQPNRPGLPAGRHRIGRANASQRLPTQTSPLRCAAPVSSAIRRSCARRAWRDLAGPDSQPTAPAAATSPAGRRLPQTARPTRPAPASPTRRAAPSPAAPAGPALPPSSRAGEPGRLADSGAECECDPDHHEEHERAEHHVVEHRRRQQLHHSGPGHVR